MSVYVILKKRKEHGISLPMFQSYQDKPELEDPKHKLLTLEEGDCVDVAKFYLSADLTYISVMEYRVSNLGGVVQETKTESYTLPRFGPAIEI